MLASILCAVLMSPGAFQDQSPKSIWVGLNIQRTGNNGYEEYLDAIDLFRQARIGSILLERGNNASPNELEVCRRILAKMGPILAKVEQGNLKEVRDPRTKFSYDTLFPELSQVKEISKAIHASAHAQFAAGDTKGATHNLILGLEMADKIGRFTLISGLVGIANHGIHLASIARNLYQLSTNDSIKFEQWVNTFFSRPNQAAQVMIYDSFWSARMIRETMINPKRDQLNEFLGTGEEGDEYGLEVEQFKNHWMQLPGTERRRIVELVCERMRIQNSSVQELLVLPEKEWTMPEMTELEGIAAKIEELVTPMRSTIFEAFARHRTQLRLLRLHCAIRQFRFEHDQLPQSLEKLNKPLYILDPLTGENFVYESKGELQYELYSRGSAQTGRIDLKYRRPLSEEKADPNIPPLPGSKIALQL